MREYGKVSPQFWNGDTSRALRGAGLECQLLAIYLIIGPTANAIGLYELPLPWAAHHLAMDLKNGHIARAFWN